ncbi:MAG: energy transducer TonB [Lautropia sp.]|nr:energy transducer TonB [Lautropia sp.]
MKPPSLPPSVPGTPPAAAPTGHWHAASAVDLETAVSLDRSPPRWPMVPALGIVLLLHAALIYGVVRTNNDLTLSSPGQQPVYVELIADTAQQPVIPAPSAPPPPPPPPPEPEPEPEPEPVVADPPPIPEPAPVYQVHKPKPKIHKPKKLKKPPPPKPAPEPPPPEPPPTPAPPAPAAPPGPASPPVQGVPNAPAGATPRAGGAPPGGAPVLGAQQVRYLRKPNAIYPAFSKRIGETGKATFRVLIDEHGVPKDVKLEKSSGSERLDKAALEGAYTARLSPYIVNGKPQQAIVVMPISFELED